MAGAFIFDINTIVQGNNGNVLPITVRNAESLEGATVRVAIKCGDFVFTKQAVLADLASGRYELTLTSTDLPAPGLYFYQPTITYADGREFTGEVGRFNVGGKLSGPPPEVIPPGIELARLGISVNGRLTIDGVEQVGGGSVEVPSNVILFEDWLGGETVTIDTGGTTPTPDTTAPILTITAGGTFTGNKTVIMSASETADIYYTLDGSTPTTSSAKYTTALSISATTTLNAFARDTAGNQSAVQTVVYTLDEGTVDPPADTTPPVLTMTAAATFTDTQTVNMSANETATIWYTVDGSDPITSGTRVQYSAPVTLTATTTVKAYAVDTAGNASGVQTVTYTKEVNSNTTVYFVDSSKRNTLANASATWKTMAFVNKQNISLKEIQSGGGTSKAWQLWELDVNYAMTTLKGSGTFESNTKTDSSVSKNYAFQTLLTPIVLEGGKTYSLSIDNANTSTLLPYTSDTTARVDNGYISNTLAKYTNTAPAAGVVLSSTGFIYDVKIIVG